VLAFSGRTAMAENAWRYEIHYRGGRLITRRERQTFAQVWHATVNCAPGYETLKFSPPPDADQSEIKQLIQLGAERI
jgi:hypothetical protein